MTADNMDDEWAAALQEQQEAGQTQGGTEADPDFLSDAEESLLQDDDADVDWAAALEEQRATEQPAVAPPPPAQRPRPSYNSGSMDLLLKIPLDISVQLGDTRLLVNDLIQLGQGSIIELNKNATSEMDLYINGKLLGSGDVVVVNEHFGVRISKIISPEERIKTLG